jgi:hypothetical protein
MRANFIPDELKPWTVTDYEFPPECCRCNSKSGDSSLEISGQLGRRGKSSLIKSFKVPICSDCLEEIKKASKARERRLVRPAVRVLIVSVAIIITFPLIFSPIMDKNPRLGFLVGLFMFASLVGIIGSLAVIISTKSGSELREVSKTVAFGPGGFVFANKDYQARVRSVTSTYVSPGLNS